MVPPASAARIFSRLRALSRARSSSSAWLHAAARHWCRHALAAFRVDLLISRSPLRRWRRSSQSRHAPRSAAGARNKRDQQKSIHPVGLEMSTSRHVSHDVGHAVKISAMSRLGGERHRSCSRTPGRHVLQRGGTGSKPPAGPLGRAARGDGHHAPHGGHHHGSQEVETADAEFVLFDVICSDGSRSSNRRVPTALGADFDGDEPAREAILDQDRIIAEKSASRLWRSRRWPVPARRRWRKLSAKHADLSLATGICLLSLLRSSS